MPMPSAATLVFPNQLFRDHPAVADSRPVYLIEETLFFNKLLFHKKKILLHRASMKAYAAYLQQHTTVHYIEAISADSDVRRIMIRLQREGITELHLADPVDDWLKRRLTKSASAAGIALKLVPTPNFLNSAEELAVFFDARQADTRKNAKTYFMADFYTAQRKKRNWLLDKSGKPVGGKWSFDTENRKRIPASQRSPDLPFPKQNAFVTEATRYVEEHFSGHYGDLSALPGGGFYPIDFEEADAWLEAFLSGRLAAFGPYEDAMRAADHFLFHSVLTPMLNTGLLKPADVLGRMLVFAEQKQIPLPSVEGFLRQVAGWREFMRILYEREGRYQRIRNFWGFSRKIPDSFRRGETGIIPVDTVVRKVLATGYAHHIERLMVLGGFMLLCEFHPDEVYRFFMEFFIDAYDWVMVPNIYGMSQFADGGLMTTKPYFSGSNYLLKMGDWKKGPWQATWDGLFWRFLSVHREIFEQQPRWKMLLGRWDGLPAATRQTHLREANDFLAGLDNPLQNDAGKTRNAGPQLF